MSVRFVIGRAGSGKTRHCVKSITTALDDAPLGPAIFWILPRSATFMAERELACSAGRLGFFRCRVLSLDSFVQTIVDECGRGGVPELTAQGRRMILGHLLRREAGHLRYFRLGGEGTEGLASRLDATIGEIERAEGGADELQTVLQGAEEEEPLLKDKLHDLHHLYQAYVQYVGQEHLDQRRRTAQVLRQIETCPLMRGATLYVDAFTRFSDMECRVLAAAARAAARAEITLMMDSDCPVLTNPHHRTDEFTLFHRTEDLYRRLWFSMSEAGVDVEQPLLLRRAAGGSTSSELGDIRGSVSFVEAPDRAGEVDAAARQVQAWVSQGMRLREIVVLTRDLEAYHGLIEASFDEHHLAFFMDRRRTAENHPVVGLLTNALWIARENWPQDAVMALIKSGLGGVTSAEADLIENYVLAHRIRGAGWAMEEPWAFIQESRDQEHPPSPSQLDLARRVDELRRKVVDPLHPFVLDLRTASAGGWAVGSVITQMRQLLQAYQASDHLSQWMAEAQSRNELEVAAEHQRVWDELHNLLNQMEILLGDQILSPEDFSSVFQSALEGFDLALTPPTVDQVLVGQLERSVIPGAKAVIVLGLNEGEFPAIPREDSILNDSDRRRLHERKINVEPDTKRRLLDERLLGYIAFTRSTEHLCVMRHRADAEGRALAPSVFWLELRRQFPESPLMELPIESTLDPHQIGTPRQLVAGLMQWVRSHKNEEAANSSLPALYDWLARGPVDHGPVDRLRDQAWAALSYENRAILPPDVAGMLFASPLEATAAQLESFAACPFQHFARYGLELKERREDQAVSGRDLSHIYHRILRRLVRHMLQQRADWSALEPAASEQLIAQYAQEVGVALKSEWMLSTARNQYLLGWIQRTLNQVVAQQRAAAARGNFLPAHVDVAFGADQPMPAVEARTPGGNILKLRGTIDRIDLLKSGAAAVMDYRLNGQTLSLAEVYYGLSLQLLISLMAVQEGGPKLTGRKAPPAAAFYLQMLRQLRNVAHPDLAGNPAEAEFHLKVKPRGLLDFSYLPDLDKTLQSGPSAVVNAYLKIDGTCGNPDRTDVAAAEQLAGLLGHVRKLVGQLVDRIIQGDIAVRPYRLGQVTPCPRCAYKSVCRFDPAMDPYHTLTPLKRTQVLEQVNAPTAPAAKLSNVKGYSANKNVHED
jgi:ATP-dependent helicase/nuclease subunit B